MIPSPKPPKPLAFSVETQDIKKRYQNQIVLDGVNLKLRPGTLYALLGKNGSGKSTLMRILMRTEIPSSGNGLILGHPLDDESRSANLEIGYVSEGIDYFLPFTIQDTFDRLAPLYPRFREAILLENLQHLDISPRKYFSQLSRGQKMQVALSFALATQPRLLLLDEITSVLDAHARAFCMQALSTFTQDGGTVLMATNIVSEVQHFAHHLLLLSDGRIAFDLPLEEATQLFVKLRVTPETATPRNFDEIAVSVALNSDGSQSYLIPRTHVDESVIPASLVDRRGITAEELFIYYTKRPEEVAA